MRPASPYELVESVAASLVVMNPRDPTSVASLAERFDSLASDLEAQAEDQDRVDLARRTAEKLRGAVAKGGTDVLAKAALEATAAVETLQRALKPAGGRRFGAPPPPPPAAPAAQPKAGAVKPAAAAPVPQPIPAGPRWDADTVAVMADFLQESAEGLAQADEILVAADSGGADSESINTLFRAFHTIKGVAGFLDLADVTRLAHTTETLLNAVREKRLQLEGDVVDVVLASVDAMRQLLAAVKKAVESQSDVPPYAGLEDLVTRLKHTEDSAAGATPEPSPAPRPVASPAPSPEPATSKPLTAPAPSPDPEPLILGEPKPAPAVKTAIAETAADLEAQAAFLSSASVKSPLPAKKGDDGAPAPDGGDSKLKETVKVDLARVDALVEMIGELVIVESMVVHAPEIAGAASPRLRTSLGQLAKITRDLQDIGMRMRMVPMRATFQKMARIVRDLAHKSGKDVRLELAGEGTELDRSMVERIADPLLHMIRNSVDHGMESSTAERVAAGKPAGGTIRLSAYHQGGGVIIEVADDGKGLDRDRILAKARERGLVGDQALSDNDIHNLIFLPGFSTAAKVTEISGRGVGMDVVRRNVEAMRGRISISTEKGHGTVFRIMLPLTLAIIDGMIITAGRERYIVPTLAIVESLKPNADTVSAYAGRGEIVRLRGEVLPLIRLSDVFGVTDAIRDPLEAKVVVVESGGRKVGILVDDVLAQQQVVIKSFESSIATTPVVSGAAILSDGRVGLIIDVDTLCGTGDHLRVTGAAARSDRTAAAGGA